MPREPVDIFIKGNNTNFKASKELEAKKKKTKRSYTRGQPVPIIMHAKFAQESCK